MEIRTLTTPQELFAAAAEEVVRSANEAVAQRGRFTHRPGGWIDPQESIQFTRDQCSRRSALGSHVFLLGRRAPRASHGSRQQLPHGGRDHAVKDSGGGRECIPDEK